MTYSASTGEDDVHKCAMPTWNSNVAGLLISAAPSRGRRTPSKFSACEHSAHVSTSVKPAAAMSMRSSSVSWFSGSSRPIVAHLGSVSGTLL